METVPPDIKELESLLEFKNKIMLNFKQYPLQIFKIIKAEFL